MATGIQISSPSENFANADLTFTGNREHDTAGNTLQITTDAGGFGESFIYMTPTLNEIGTAGAYTDYTTRIDHLVSPTGTIQRIAPLGVSIGFGATDAQARLDVRAQGALSTDIAFRVRNSADTANIFSVNGNGVFYKPHASSNDDNAQDVFVSQMSDGRNRIRLFTKGSFNVSASIGISFQSDAAGTNISSYTLAGASILNNQSYKDNGNLSIFHVGGSNVTQYSYLQLRNFSNSATNIYISRTGTIILNPDNVNAQVRGLAIFGGTLGTTADRVISIGNGTAPTTSTTDNFQFWSADIVAGNAAPHFRTENGSIIKLYKETAANVGTGATFTNGSGTVITEDATFGGLTLAQIAKALGNLGLVELTA